jgi:3-methylfumaryl-CoA hydratase
MAVAVLQPGGTAQRRRADGHPKRGGFLPPIELPRRMWAGSRLRYLARVPVDAERRRGRILKVENKVGSEVRSGFVTVSTPSPARPAECIVEEQDIVYREATPPGARTSAAAA